MSKILISITSRASLGRSKTVIEALLDQGAQVHISLSASSIIEKFGDVRPELSAIGKKYEGLSVIEFDTLLDSSSKSSLVKTLSLGMFSLSDYISNSRIDSVITIADRYETLASSIVASYHGIRLIHLQGGEKSGNIDDKVRNANSMLADVHFPTTENSRKRLLAMLDSHLIYNYGCPSIDLARQSLEIEPFLPSGAGSSFDLNQPFMIVMQHPEYPCKFSAIDQIRCTLESVRTFELPVLWFWPNADFGTNGTVSEIRKRREQGQLNHILFVKNTTPLNFLSILRKTRVIIGNSSAGIREASFLGIPAVNIGTRQSNRERANNVFDADYDCESISASVKSALAKGRLKSSSLFGDGFSGIKIATEILRLLK